MQSFLLMLWRGMRRRCPRRGSGGLFRHWFRMAPRCPGCGYRFAREDGFHFGGYVINFAVTEGVVGAAMFGYILAAAANPDTPLWPVFLGGALAAVLTPLLFYPFSRTIWAAIDLILAPLEPAEEAEAILAREERHR